MKTKTRWLLIVLVALLQVATLLLAEIFMFGWFRAESTNVMTNKVFEENAALFHSIERQLQATTPADPGSWLATAEMLVRSTSVPDQGFLSISDAETGEMLVPAGPELQGWWAGVVPTDQNVVATMREPIQLVVGALQVRNGVSEFNNEKFLVSAYQPVNHPYIFGIHRKQSRVMNAAENALSFAHKVSFGLVLLLGLVTSSLIFTFLNRFKNRILQINEELQRSVTERAEELDKSKNAVIFGLAKLAESRDNDTGEHLDRIRKYVTVLVKDLEEIYVEVDEEFIQNLGIASSLHDIGKVGIPDSILLKPGRLTAKERSIMEMHAVIGGECLEAIQGRLGDNEFMNIATQVAYSHHERWDGTGYPYGLSEEEIPLVARIVSVADVYDALTSKRPYKKAMSHLESRAIIVAGSGTQFDPEIVSAFLRHEREFEVISIRQQFINDEEATSTFQKLAEAVEAQTMEERKTMA